MSQPPAFASVLHAPTPGEYGRQTNASFEALETAIGALEGGTAVVFASGMAAISAVVATTVRGRPGLVQPLDGYHGTRNILAETPGLWVQSLDIADTAEIIEAVPDGGVIWAESPTNPRITVADIAGLAEGAAAKDVILVIDTTVGTPICQRPLELGAHIVVHSVTKYLSGHSDVILGAVVSNDEHFIEAIRNHRTLHGAIPGPMECFLALRGIRTLDVRMQRAMSNALEIARRLDAHDKVSRVHYPGLESDPGHEVASRQMTGGYGALLSFVMADELAAETVCVAANLVVYSTSLGGVETSMERRGRQSGEEDTHPGLIRLSVGIEDVSDIWADLSQALDQA